MSLSSLGARAYVALSVAAVLLIFVGFASASDPSSVEEIAPGVYQAAGVHGDRALDDRIDRMEAEHRTKVDAPAARRERELSRHKFRGLGPAEVKDLLWSIFGEQIESLNVNYADEVLDADKVIEFRGSDAALIDPAGKRKRTLVVSNAPLRDSEGRVIDLSLERVGGGFSPVASLVDVQIADELEDGISLGDLGVSFTLDGVNSSVDASVSSEEGSDLVVFLCVTGAFSGTNCGKARPRLSYWLTRFTPTSYVKDVWPSLKTVVAGTKIR